MADAQNHYSGVDWERDVYLLYGGSSYATAGVLTARDDSIDTSQVETAINDALQSLWLALVELEADCTLVSLEYTYPAQTERVAMSAIFPGEVLRFLQVYDRDVETMPYPPIPYYPLETFWDRGGDRWTERGGFFYFADARQTQGPSADKAMRLEFIGLPPRVLIADATVRTDIPAVLTRAIATAAAADLKVQKQDESEAARAVALAGKLRDEALRALSTTTHQARKPVWTQRPFPA